MRRSSRSLVTLLSLALSGVAVSGCATFITGTTEEVTIASEPAGASCRVERMGQPVAVVKSTPETIRIPRSRFPLDVYCTKDMNGGASITPSYYNPVAMLNPVVPYLVDAYYDADRSQPDVVLVRFPMSR